MAINAPANTGKTIGLFIVTRDMTDWTDIEIRVIRETPDGSLTVSRGLDDRAVPITHPTASDLAKLVDVFIPRLLPRVEASEASNVG